MPSEREGFLCVADGAFPGVTVLEIPAGVEDGMHEAPLLCPRAVEPQLGAEDIQPAAIDFDWNRSGNWIAEELADVEAPVADQPFRIDRKPIGAPRPQDVEVMQIAVEHDRRVSRVEKLPPQGIGAPKQIGRKAT